MAKELTRFVDITVSRYLLIILFAACLAIFGCGSTAEPTGSAEGTITYNGSPLTSGMVNLHSDDQSVVGSAEIDGEGHFEFDNDIPAGNYRVYLTPPPPPAPPEPGDPPREALPEFAVPKKYRSAQTTTLTVTIKAGSNEIPLTLLD